MSLRRRNIPQPVEVLALFALLALGLYWCSKAHGQVPVQSVDPAAAVDGDAETYWQTEGLPAELTVPVTGVVDGILLWPPPDYDPASYELGCCRELTVLADGEDIWSGLLHADWPAVQAARVTGRFVDWPPIIAHELTLRCLSVVRGPDVFAVAEAQPRQWGTAEPAGQGVRIGCGADCECLPSPGYTPSPTIGWTAGEPVEQTTVAAVRFTVEQAGRSWTADIPCRLVVWQDKAGETHTDWRCPQDIPVQRYAGPVPGVPWAVAVALVAPDGTVGAAREDGPYCGADVWMED